MTIRGYLYASIMRYYDTFTVFTICEILPLPQSHHYSSSFLFGQGVHPKQEAANAGQVPLSCHQSNAYKTSRAAICLLAAYTVIHRLQNSFSCTMTTIKPHVPTMGAQNINNHCLVCTRYAVSPCCFCGVGNVRDGFS